MTNTEKLPAKLKEAGLFCVWKREQRNGGITKVPYNPRTGGKAQSNNPETFAPLPVAEEVQPNYSGIGIGIFNDISAIDIDHCINEDGTISDMAGDIISTMLSYTEYSPSGKGVHILFSAPNFKYDKSKYYIHNQKIGLEIYVAGATQKYVTVTGNAIADNLGFENRGMELQKVLDKYMLRPVSQVSNTAAAFPQYGKDYLQIGLEKDNKFRALWAGERQTSNESSNDIALMNKLAYWCNCDISMMKAAFLSSPYAKQKDDAHWKKAAERQDYLQRTAVRATQDCTKTAAQSEEEYQAARQQQAKQYFSITIGGGAKTKFINPVETPQALKRYTLDDMGTARLFADTFRGLALYLPEYKSYWTYSAGVWKQDKGELKTRRLAKDMAEYIRKIIPAPSKPGKAEGPVTLNQTEKDSWTVYRKYYSKYRFLKHRKNLIQDAQDELCGNAGDFDQQPLLFNVKNGTLNLETMQLQDHNPDDRLSKMANASYDPTAKCERFERFIMEITEGKQERADMLQKALGYALKGEANEECYFTAIGEKTRNGKGTLFDTILNIFGSYGAQMDFNTIARGGAKDGSRATPDLARLIGIRLALANEPEKGVCVNEALLKQITGGDDITARPLYGDLIEFKPAFKLFVTANSKPTVSDDSLFASNRIKLLPFTRHFSENERDTGLKARFRTEEAKSGILNWLLAGYKKYLAEGLKDTAEMKSLTAEYRKENDYIGLYLGERFNFGANSKTTVKALRYDYATWCNVIGTKPLGLKLFKEELEKHSIEIKIIHNQFCIDGAISNGYDYAGENSA